MTYPFMADPAPPGHGEAVNPREGQWPESGRVYAVIVVLGDGVPNTESRWARLSEALDERDHVNAALKKSGYTRFFVGVQDDDDSERGWLDWGDDE